jgi:hypothetical protein
MGISMFVRPPPIPVSDAEAWKELLDDADNDLEREGEPSDAMLHYLLLLTAQFPEGGEAVWSTTPVFAGMGPRSLVVDVVTSMRAAPAITYMIELANEMGLAVFDPQSEKIHRPPSKVVVPRPSGLVGARIPQLREEWRTRRAAQREQYARVAAPPRPPRVGRMPGTPRAPRPCDAPGCEKVSTESTPFCPDHLVEGTLRAAVKAPRKILRLVRRMLRR